MRVTTRTFPDPQGLCPVPVTEYTLQNDHGVSVSCINYGAIITDVRMPDRNGNVESIVLRFPDLTGYIAHGSLYLGAIVGRTAGRLVEQNDTAESLLAQCSQRCRHCLIGQIGRFVRCYEIKGLRPMCEHIGFGDRI